MATNHFYNLREDEPAANNANRNVLIQAAQAEAVAAVAGDGNPLPPPFSYGKIYRIRQGRPDDKATEKLPPAPNLTIKDYKELLISLKKPIISLDLAAPPVGAAAIPTDLPDAAPTGLLAQARAATREKEASKIWKRIRENLNSRVINRQTSSRSELGIRRRNQDSYEWLIKITTNLTGKHSIWYSTQLTTHQERGNQGPRTRKQIIQDLSAGVEYPTLQRHVDAAGKRTQKTAPYSKIRNKKNKEWMSIAKQIDKNLPELFHDGNELAFPNPLYPNQMRQDKIFRINSFSLKFLPKKLRYLVSDNKQKDRFKFYITHNPKKPVTRGNIEGDPYLYVVAHVYLEGEWVKGRHTIDPTRALPVTAAVPAGAGAVPTGAVPTGAVPTGAGAVPAGAPGATSKCDKNMNNVKNDVKNILSQWSIFGKTPKDKFGKKMKKAKESVIAALNMRLFSENKAKAIAYWMQEFYCRCTMNFNAGIDAGWPNITAVTATRFPFDPWTLQPGIPGSYKMVNYMDQWAVPGDNNNSPNLPTLANIYRRRRIPFPIPFSPFGMSLKPKMVEILFKRIENILNAAATAAGAAAGAAGAAAAIAAATAAAATAAGAAAGAAAAATAAFTAAVRNLIDIRIRGKLPRLTTLTPPQLEYIFTLYEYALYHDFGDTNSEFNWYSPILEPYRPYPELPTPQANNNYGRWVININGDTQFAIPVETGTAPWRPAAAPQAEPPGLAVAPRYDVTWQQIKANNFYKKEAKKWAKWMILAHPFPIPGFPIYADYIYLRQKYILYKLSGVSNSAVPQAAQPFFPNGLRAIIRRGQFPLPPPVPQPVQLLPLMVGGMPFGPQGTNDLVRRRGESRSRTWLLFFETYRTRQYNNPYSRLSRLYDIIFPLRPPPRNLFAETLMDRTPWNQNKELFVGPEANKYPIEIWPSNNMKRVIPNDVAVWPLVGHPPAGAAPWRNYFRAYEGGNVNLADTPQQIFPALMDLPLRYNRQAKRQNMGGWSGGRKRTLKRRKRKRRRTLKKRKKK